MNDQNQKSAFNNLLDIIIPDNKKTYESVKEHFIEWLDNWEGEHDYELHTGNWSRNSIFGENFLQEYIYEELIGYTNIINIIDRENNDRLNYVIKTCAKGYKEWNKNFPDISLNIINYITWQNKKPNTAIDRINLIDTAQYHFIESMLNRMYEEKYNDKLIPTYLDYEQYKQTYSGLDLKYLINTVEDDFNLILQKTKLHEKEQEIIQKEHDISYKEYFKIVRRCYRSGCPECITQTYGMFCKKLNKEIKTDDICPKESKNITAKKTNNTQEEIKTTLPKNIRDAIESYAVAISNTGNNYSDADSIRIETHNKLCELLGVDKNDFKPFELNTSVINGNMDYKTAVNMITGYVEAHLNKRG